MAGVAERDQVKVAAAARAACGDAKLVSSLADIVAKLALAFGVELAGHRAVSDARLIGLENSKDSVQRARSDSRAS